MDGIKRMKVSKSKRWGRRKEKKRERRKKRTGGQKFF
jgi:hypothetical protein